MNNPVLFTFKAPTKNTDGSDIGPGEIDFYSFQWGTKQGGPYTGTFKDTALTPDAQGLMEIDAVAAGIVPGKLADGTWFGVVFAHAVGDATTPAGNLSVPSNEISFGIKKPLPVPQPPTSFSAQ